MATMTAQENALTHIERKQRRARMARVVADGCTLAKAAESFGVSLATVSAACVENGVTPVGKHAARQARHAAVLAEIRDGQDLGDVADRYGYTVGGVYYICKMAGVQVAHRKPPRQNKPVKIAAYLLTTPGVTQEDVARRYGVTRQYISYVAGVLKEAGFTRAQPAEVTT